MSCQMFWQNFFQNFWKMSCQMLWQIFWQMSCQIFWQMYWQMFWQIFWQITCYIFWQKWNIILWNWCDLFLSVLLTDVCQNISSPWKPFLTNLSTTLPIYHFLKPTVSQSNPTNTEGITPPKEPASFTRLCGHQQYSHQQRDLGLQH